MSQETNNEPIKSPIEIPYDYLKRREETTTPVMQKILKLVGDNADKITFTGQFTMEEFNDRFDAVARDVKAIMAEGDIVESDRRYIFDYLSSVFSIIADNIAKEIDGHKREILSRIVGKRNPGNDKFDVDYCNYGDILTALVKVREQTGNNNEDYFFITKPNQE